MRRRRRPQREIAFSFDSFLDEVANVVGIILRLIVIAWVGTRSYKALVPMKPLPPRPALVQPPALPEPTEPRAAAVAAARQDAARQRREAGDREERLLLARREAAALGGQLRALGDRRKAMATAREEAARQADVLGQEATRTALSARELARRAEKLLLDVGAARARPPKRTQVRYPAPVS